MSNSASHKKRLDARAKLLEAALSVIRRKGYSATTVEDLCRGAGVTKGAFFHHFRSKEDLAVAAAGHWSYVTGKLFEAAPYHSHKDPLERLIAYVHFRKALITGAVPEFTCLAGTMVQEVYETSIPIREACSRSIVGHAKTLTQDFAAAAKHYGVKLPVSAESLALHTQAVIQGAFVLAKAGNDSKMVIESLNHLLHYIRLIFTREKGEKEH